jgi:SAM-dependent methyltransferase
MIMTASVSRNRYVIDIEQGAETARLVEQDRLVTLAMGGLLPEQADPSAIKQVLDIACGPGSWVIEMPYAYPHMHLTGIDLSATTITYARAVAQTTWRDNVTFRVMDACQPLDFADACFDLVNGRFLVGFLDQGSWPRLVAECLRILKPGGILRLSECELGLSSSLSLQCFRRLLAQALYAQGRTFSVDGQSIGICHVLGKLLRDAGFLQVQHRPFLLEASSGTSLYNSSMQETALTFALLKPYLIGSALVDEARFDKLYRDLLDDMASVDFTSVSFGLTVWGIKSASSGMP